MKIIDVATLCLSHMHELEQRWFTAGYHILQADCAIVVIKTDEGLVGIGEAYAYGIPLLISMGMLV